DDRMVVFQFDPDQRDQGNDGNDAEGDDERRVEPVLLLPLIQHDLQRSHAGNQQKEPPVVDGERSGSPAQILRIEDEEGAHDHGDYPDREVDVENPAPAHVVGDPPPESRTYDRTEHGANPEDGHRHAALVRRKRFHQDRLADRDQGAPRGSLENPEEYQCRQIGRGAAEERGQREQHDAGHQEALAAEHARQPAGHRQYHGVGDEVGGQDPGDLVRTGIEAPLHVRQGHVGDRGVDDLHDGGEHDGNGDQPFVDVSVFWHVLSMNQAQGKMYAILTGFRPTFLASRLL